MFILEQSGQQTASRLFDLRDRGLLLADGVFDTSLIVHGTMILREAHLNRLINDASAFDIAIKHQRIDALLDEVLDRNHNGVLRITVTSGPAGRGIARTQSMYPTILLSLSPLDTSNQFTPISLQTSLIRRNSTSPTSRHKTLAYTDNIAAIGAAHAAGYEDALFMNEQGNVCCTTTGNLFLKFGDAWATPPISDGVLPGIMRQWIIDNASDIGLKIVERQITEDEMHFAESAFVVNSVRLVVPVQKINERELKPQLPARLRCAAVELVRIPQ